MNGRRVAQPGTSKLPVCERRRPSELFFLAFFSPPVTFIIGGQTETDGTRKNGEFRPGLFFSPRRKAHKSELSARPGPAGQPAGRPAWPVEVE
jgi:hypothetical protein